MIFSNNPNTQKEKKHKCKIKIKRNSDGSVSKSIEGECSREELNALNETN